MSRFAKKTQNRNVTTNYEGAKAYDLTPEMQLYSFVCTSVLNPKFYTPQDNSKEIIRSLIKNVSPEFANKLAIYARQKMYLRTIPLVLTVELARIGKLEVDTVVNVIERADEIYELLAYYQIANDRKETKKLNKLSSAISKGIKKIFESGKFDEYQFAKYNRKTDVTFKDAIFLTHPKARDKKMDKLFKAIINDELKTPYTWETELSTKGNTKDVWEGLIESKKVGYMALLRNLRNILQANVSKESMKIVCDYLSDPEAVANSKQLPFRFLSAYREIQGVPNFDTKNVLKSLESAVKHTASNIRGYDDETNVLIACDVSGSMCHPISEKSKIQNYDIGLILGMILQSRCNKVITGIFGDTWKTENFPQDNILQNTMYLRRIANSVGYSTNGWKVLHYALEKKLRVDKFMIFTDCQMWDSTYHYTDRSGMSTSWALYKEFYPEAKMYLFDLAGHGNTPLDIRNGDVYLIAGWSDKIFDVLASIEEGQDIIKNL